MKIQIMKLVLVACISMTTLSMADVITLNATGRGSFYRPAFGGWDGPAIGLTDDKDQYIKFDIGALANNPNVAIDSAVVTILNGSSHVSSWNGIWDSVAGLYRAPDLNFVTPYSYDSSVMYSQDGMHESLDSVFVATNLVTGWAAGSWSGVTGGVALHYINPPVNGQLIYQASDLAGATLAINYHTVPEPASFMVLGIGVFGLLLRRRPKSA